MKKVYGTESVNVSNLFKKSKITTERLDHLTINKDFGKFFSGDLKNLKLTWLGEKEAMTLLKQHVSA